MEIIMDTLTAPLEPSSETPPETEGLNTSIGHSEVRVRGKPVFVPSVLVEGRTVIMSGRWLKKASVQDEYLLEGETIADPAVFVQRLKQTAPTADIFTFFQRLPDTTPKYTYHMEWDNIAVIPITTFSNWWEKHVDPGVRRAVRKAAKTGVVVKLVEFDDAF